MTFSNPTLLEYKVLPMLEGLRLSSTLWEEIKLGSISVSLSGIVAAGNICLFFQLSIFTKWCEETAQGCSTIEVASAQRVRANMSCGPCDMWGLDPVSPVLILKSHDNEFLHPPLGLTTVEVVHISGF